MSAQYAHYWDYLSAGCILSEGFTHSLVTQAMEFWGLVHPDEALAAIDARSGRHWTYARLRVDAARLRSALSRVGRKSLGLLIAANRYECLVAYLAALNSNAALILLDASLSSDLQHQLVAAYRPDWIFGGTPDCLADGYRQSASGEECLFENERPEELEIHRDLALLLSTSGSTGSPKLVRLTHRNLQANAVSIAQYLQLTPEQRPITSLPMAYSYGLSVINSHLQAGAAIVFSDDTVLRREFWDAVDRYACTSFAGVPYTYQLLLQTGLLNKKGSSLKTLTQAGGKLNERYTRQMNELALARGWKFFVMYGQTEATARISYVPFEQLGSKTGSIGVAVPDGFLKVDQQTGELIYSGPNVMMGYAECRADLAKGDELQGLLPTGDLAREDADGYFYITGRLKRFLKLFGKRFNLDEVESVLIRRLNLALACFGHDDMLMVATESRETMAQVESAVCRIFDLPRTAVKVISVTELPRTISGKIDYPRLSDAGRQSESMAARQI